MEEEKELTLLQRLARLLKVKSIVTILLTCTFVYLSIIGVIAADQFMTVFTVVVSFFFGVKSKEGKE